MVSTQEEERGRINRIRGDWLIGLEIGRPPPREGHVAIKTLQLRLHRPPYPLLLSSTSLAWLFISIGLNVSYFIIYSFVSTLAPRRVVVCAAATHGLRISPSSGSRQVSYPYTLRIGTVFRFATLLRSRTELRSSARLSANSSTTFVPVPSSNLFLF